MSCSSAAEEAIFCVLKCSLRLDGIVSEAHILVSYYSAKEAAKEILELARGDVVAFQI